MQSVAFFNNKGGVGKTTLLCNIAGYLALKEQYNILIIDADPQCNATQLLLEILTDKILPTCFIKLLLETLVIDNSLLVKNLAIVTILVSVTVIIFLKAFTITVAVVDNILNILPVDFTKAVVEVNAEESACKKTFPPVPLMTTLSIAKPLISIP